jgi:hypothetical protein
MDLTQKAIELLENCNPAGVRIAEELPRIKATLGQHVACTFDLQATDRFKGHNNQQFPFRGFDKLACAFNFGNTTGCVILDGNEALVLVHFTTLSEWGYREDKIKFGVTSSTVTGQPLTFGADPSSGQFYFSRNGMIRLSPAPVDPLADRKELTQLGKVRKQVADITSAFSAWESEVTSRAQKIENLKREEDRHQETIDSTDSKCKRLDSKIAGIEAKIRKGKASADRMATMTGEVHRLTLAHDGYASAYNAADERLKEIAKEVKTLRKPVPMPERLKTLLG